MSNEAKPASKSMTIINAVIALLSFVGKYVFADKPEIVQLLNALIGVAGSLAVIGLRKGQGVPITFGKK